MEKTQTRRQFLTSGLLAGAGSLLLPSFMSEQVAKVMTVSGWLSSEKMGFTLTHEHVMVDFSGAEKYSKGHYNADEVFDTALPFLKGIKTRGVDTLIDCTPAYLGRDANILRRLADATGLNILTTTGFYGAANEKFVPSFAYNETPEQLAGHWINEWEMGIEGTGIKPGFIKTGTDKGPLTPMQRKLLKAAGIAHLSTGLVIAVHSGNGDAAFEQLDILKDAGVSPGARIWVHAQNESNKELHVKAGKLKTWVSFDGVNPDSLQTHLDYLLNMKQNNLLEHVLVSQDSGWYNVGDPRGGNFKPYTCLLTQFIPLLRQNGFTDTEINLVFKTNPANAFAVRVRKL